jgi:hypothetical protein
MQMHAGTACASDVPHMVTIMRGARSALCSKTVCKCMCACVMSADQRMWSDVPLLLHARIMRISCVVQQWSCQLLHCMALLMVHVSLHAITALLWQNTEPPLASRHHLQRRRRLHSRVCARVCMYVHSCMRQPVCHLGQEIRALAMRCFRARRPARAK